MLPRFSFEHRFTAETARHDRIKVKMVIGQLFGTLLEQDHFRSLMHTSENHGHWRDFHFFGNSWSSKVPIRAEPVRRQEALFPAPLFRGDLRFNTSRDSVDSPPELGLDLDFSPTRLARFQNVPRNPETDLFKLLGGEAPMMGSEEFSLDGKDNWILIGAQDLQFGPSYWTQHLEECFEQIHHEIQMELMGLTEEGATARMSPAEGYLLNSCETCWEFQSDNPSGHVQQMASLLADFGLNLSATNYRLPVSVRVQTLKLGLSLSIKIRSGVVLRIYSKTN